MSKSNSNASAAESSEFVLKHRIAGAAFLLFFGALFLPWVLGAPGKPADKPNASQVVTQETPSEVKPLANRDLAEALASEQVQVPEQVYISKITPLDADGAGVQTQVPTGSNSKPAEQKAQLEKPRAQQTQTQEQSKPAPVKVAKADPAPKPSGANPSQTKPSENKPVTPEPVKQQAPKPIEVGWVVQVGVFTDKKGADRVVEDLRDKGFSPSTTVVDTNRGKNTGTRIWLGPYAQRVEAAKAKAELTKQTGEAGFIRAYP